MLRFSVNRWWAFILTLFLFSACFLVVSARCPTVAYATQVAPVMDPGGNPGGVSGFGDPDVPVGPGQGYVGKTSIARGGSRGSVAGGTVRSGGDGTPVSSVLMQRLRLILLSLRSRFIGF